MQLSQEHDLIGMGEGAALQVFATKPATVPTSDLDKKYDTILGEIKASQDRVNAIQLEGWKKELEKKV